MTSETKKVWVCTDATDYEGTSIEAVYADIHGARAWVRRQRERVVRKARADEREEAKLEGRRPDFSLFHLHYPSLTPDACAWSCGAQMFKAEPWTVLP